MRYLLQGWGLNFEKATSRRWPLCVAICITNVYDGRLAYVSGPLGLHTVLPLRESKIDI